MNIIEELYKIQEEFCSKYCKYPEQYETKYAGVDPDEIANKMCNEVCEKCPMNKIG